MYIHTCITASVCVLISQAAILCPAQVEVAKTEGPTVRYVDGPNGISVSFPEGFAFPLAAQKGPPEWFVKCVM